MYQKAKLIQIVCFMQDQSPLHTFCPSHLVNENGMIANF
ncbi:hypothetical protein pah_c022o092 [Parachlamydia acanthamoebae str. Hall's coccus]|nr:hypothetical protein pah_c022o092 [Parachlamydia acanthamoebae str. Hall's coccus]